MAKTLTTAEILERYQRKLGEAERKKKNIEGRVIRTVAQLYHMRQVVTRLSRIREELYACLAKGTPYREQKPKRRRGRMIEL